MRRSDEGQYRAERRDWWTFTLVIAAVMALVFSIMSCTGSLGAWAQPGGASLYCKDKQGKAIHCPERSDSTTTDTTHRER